MKSPTPDDSDPRTSKVRTRIAGAMRRRAEITLQRHPLPLGARWLTGWVLDYVEHFVGDTFDDFADGKDVLSEDS